MTPGTKLKVEVLDWDRWFQDSSVGYANVPLTHYGKRHNVKMPIFESEHGYRLSSEVVLGSINFDETANFSKVMRVY